MAKREMKSTKVEETVIEEPVVETVVETPVEKVEEPIPVPVFGIVANCSKLNIRKEAKKEADAVTVVNAGSKLTIDLDCKNKKWYKVTTADGKNGYCMKEFVTIEE